tara:strand:+ start:351 stop:1091 length:741 start_codon:yes stop_codon:yes gene_type:complete
MNIKPLPFLIIFLYLNASASPIVDIENIRQSGEAGKLKNVAFALSGSRGNEDRDDYNISLTFVNNSENIERLFVFEKSKRTKDDVAEKESSFLHARLLRQLDNKPYDIETYIQNSENPFQRYKSRTLLGGGLRFDELEHILVSVSLLFEDEESLEGIQKSTERANLYLFKDFKFSNNSFISISSFFQPSLKDFSDDYKYSLTLNYSVPVSESFTINFKLSESYDNDPPDLAEKSDQALITSFNYSF